VIACDCTPLEVCLDYFQNPKSNFISVITARTLPGCCHLQIKGFFSVCRYAQIHSEVMILSAWRTRPAPLTITSAERRAAKRNDIYFYAGFIPSITKLYFKVPSGMSKLVSVKSHVSI